MTAEVKKGPWRDAPFETKLPDDFPRYRATHALLFAVATNGGDALDDMALLGGLITTKEIPMIDAALCALNIAISVNPAFATGAWVHHAYVLTDAGRERLHAMNAKGDRTEPPPESVDAHWSGPASPLK